MTLSKKRVIAEAALLNVNGAFVVLKVDLVCGYPIHILAFEQDSRMINLTDIYSFTRMCIDLQICGLVH